MVGLPELAVVPGVMCDGVGPVEVLSPAFASVGVLSKELFPDLDALALATPSCGRTVAVPRDVLSATLSGALPATILPILLVDGGSTITRLANGGSGESSSMLSSSLHIASSASLAETRVIWRAFGPGRLRQLTCLPVTSSLS